MIKGIWNGEISFLMNILPGYVEFYRKAVMTDGYKR